MKIDDMAVDKERLRKIIERKKRKLEEAMNVLIEGGNEEVIVLVKELFGGDLNVAVDWLTSPIATLNGDAPVDRLNSDEGRELIRKILGRIEHGVFF